MHFKEEGTGGLQRERWAVMGRGPTSAGTSLKEGPPGGGEDEAPKQARPEADAAEGRGSA